MKKGMVVTLAIILALIMAACTNSGGNNENTPTSQPAENTSTNQPATDEAALDPNVPAWQLDTSPVDLTWFVGANWYGHTWGESLTSKYV
ncbi:hypothetical protein AB4Z21_04540, partial [Paenibacillus sp. MCAF20]